MHWYNEQYNRDQGMRWKKYKFVLRKKSFFFNTGEKSIGDAINNLETEEEVPDQMENQHGILASSNKIISAGIRKERQRHKYQKPTFKLTKSLGDTEGCLGLECVSDN